MRPWPTSGWCAMKNYLQMYIDILATCVGDEHIFACQLLQHLSEPNSFILKMEAELFATLRKNFIFINDARTRKTVTSATSVVET
jgi:hypothetical protein